jgi:hypothetical protein
MKLFKYIILFSLLVIFIFSINISNKSNIAENIRNDKPINILLIGSNDNSFESCILLHYEPSNNHIMLFPILPETKIFYIEKNSFFRLHLIFSFLMNKNKNLNSTCKELTNIIETYSAINIPYYIHLDKNNFYNLLKIIHPKTKYPIIYENLFNKENKISNYMHQFDTLLNIREILGNKNILLNIINIIKNIKNHISTNLTITDIAILFSDYKNFRNKYPMFICAPVYSDDTGAYIQENINNLKNERTLNFVKVEVLNGSGKPGLAYDTTRLLRNKKIDVQFWDNYPNIEYKTMIIDRTGNWYNAKKVAKVIGKGILFSQKDIYKFVDVSIILGENK